MVLADRSSLTIRTCRGRCGETSGAARPIVRTGRDQSSDSVVSGVSVVRRVRGFGALSHHPVVHHVGDPAPRRRRASRRRSPDRCVRSRPRSSRRTCTSPTSSSMTACGSTPWAVAISASVDPSRSWVRTSSASRPSRSVTTSETTPPTATEQSADRVHRIPPPGPRPSPTRKSPRCGPLSTSCAATASACSAVMVPSSTNGCSCSRSRAVRSTEAAGHPVPATRSPRCRRSSVVVGHRLIRSMVLRRRIARLLGTAEIVVEPPAAFVRPGTPNASPAAVPPRSPAARPNGQAAS